MKGIDINCDMGEGYGNYQVGNDEALMPYVSSCNIACGFHGGDPVHILRTLSLAKKFNVRTGAHPGYPDLNGFGRRFMQLSVEELNASIIYQLSALIGMANTVGVEIEYVKPHGALYHVMTRDPALADVVIHAIKKVDATLQIMGLAGSDLQHWVRDAGMRYIPEAFADRQYDAEGQLMPRSAAGSVLLDPAAVVRQVSSIVQASKVKTNVGTYIDLNADSICVHGDNENALEILKSIHQYLQDQ